MQSTYTGGEDYNEILFNSFSEKLQFTRDQLAKMYDDQLKVNEELQRQVEIQEAQLQKMQMGYSNPLEPDLVQMQRF